MSEKVFSFDAIFPKSLLIEGSSLGLYVASAPTIVDGATWSVRIYPSGKNEYSKRFMSCFLCLESPSPNTVKRVLFKMNFIAIEALAEKAFSKKIFSHSTPLWGENCFVKRKVVLESKIGHTFTMKVSMTVYDIEVKETRKRKIETLSEAMLSYLSPDIEIVVGGERIATYSVLLSARSVVFRAMVSSGMSESITREIHIPEFQSSVLRAMVHYIHSDECPTSALQSHAEELLDAACKYAIEGLQCICEDYLSAHVDCSNAKNLLIVADKFNKRKLKLAALDVCAHYPHMIFAAADAFEKLTVALYQDIITTMAGIPLPLPLPLPPPLPPSSSSSVDEEL